MDAVTSALDKVKEFAKSSQNFVDGLVRRRREKLYSRNPVFVIRLSFLFTREVCLLSSFLFLLFIIEYYCSVKNAVDYMLEE